MCLDASVRPAVACVAADANSSASTALDLTLGRRQYRDADLSARRMRGQRHIMKKNPPGSNNPTNPLHKVAALTLVRGETKRTKSKPSAKTPVKVSLNFASSDQMTGEARDLNGQKVAISFSLAIRKATLDLRASFVDSPKDASAKLSFEAIAHQTSLVRPTKISTSRETKQTGKIGGKLKVPIEAKASTSRSPTLTGTVKAEGDVAAERSTKATSKRSISFDELNVEATSGGDGVHWSVNRLIGVTNGRDRSNRESYLLGEVFKTARNASLAAATLSKSPAALPLAYELVASVRVLMSDLAVSNVKFTDHLGDHVRLARIDPELVGRSMSIANKARDKVELAAEAMGANSERLRGRVMLEVIRRHLRDQGLDTSGATVEICKARD